MEIKTFYPAILYPATEGQPAGCVIPGVNINAGGDTDENALNDAVQVLSELLSNEATEPPAPVEAVIAEIARQGGQLVWLPALGCEERPGQ